MPRVPYTTQPWTPRGRRRHSPLAGKMTQQYRDQLKRELQSEDPKVRGYAAQQFIEYQKHGGHVPELHQHIQRQKVK